MSVIGKKVNKLQNKIVHAKKELAEINKLKLPRPEFINTTNMLRSNEYLQKANEKKSHLIMAYEEYTNELENLVSTISKIQGNLTNLRSRLKSRKKIKKRVKRKKKLRKKIRKRKTKAKPRRRKLRKKRK